MQQIEEIVRFEWLRGKKGMSQSVNSGHLYFLVRQAAPCSHRLQQRGCSPREIPAVSDLNGDGHMLLSTWAFRLEACAWRCLPWAAEGEW
jgi:hypothetical protein